MLHLRVNLIVRGKISVSRVDQGRDAWGLLVEQRAPFDSSRGVHLKHAEEELSHVLRQLVDVETELLVTIEFHQLFLGECARKGKGAK